MRLLIFSPLGMTKLAELIQVMNSWGDKDNVVRSKRVIVNRELAQKLFEYLPQEQTDAVVIEWVGSIVHTALIKVVGPEASELMDKMLIYISPEDRSEREMRLLFPEYFI